MSDAYETILYGTDGPVATITLNRPERKNTIVPPMPDEVKDAVGRAVADGGAKVNTLRGAGLAFCAGWLRPRVYVSTGVLGRLSDSELRAVLAHEQHHGALRDPLRLAVSRVLCQALFFLPVLRPLHDRSADVAELRADAAALEASNGATAPLASPLLALRNTNTGDAGDLYP